MAIWRCTVLKVLEQETTASLGLGHEHLKEAWVPGYGAQRLEVLLQGQ